MIILYGRIYFTFSITIRKRYDIERVHLKKVCQSLNSMVEKICVGNGRFLYFNDDDKLDIYYI